MRDKLIERNGSPVRMELAMDVSDPERIDSIIQNSMQCQNLLASCIQPLSAELGLREAFQFALERTGDFFGTDSGYVYCYDGPLPNTVWSAGPDGPVLFGEELSKDGMERWKERLQRQGHRQVILRDVEDIAGENREVYRFLKEMGIFSFCATPIFIGERAAGLFCLCNVRVHQGDLAVLRAVADYLSGQIQREELHQEKEKALFYDSLTGCLNFEGFKQRVGAHFAQQP